MTSKLPLKRPCALVLAIALVVGTAPVAAQDMDHSSMQMPAPTPAPAARTPEQTPSTAPTSAPKPASDPHAGHVMPAPESKPEPAATTTMDHSAMGHDMPPAEPTEGMDHSAMGHPMPRAEEPAEAMDHAAMGHDMPPAEPQQVMDHAGMDHAAMGHDMPMDATADPDLPATAAPLEPIPPVTPADRAAAFQDLDAHAVHGTSVHWFALLDRIETWDADEGDALHWEGSGWIGTDLDRVWVRSEGEAYDGSVEEATVEVMYGRAIAPWWDAVVGLRHDFGDDPSHTFAAVGVIGLAPYMFEVEATAYFGESGQTGLGVEAEYETLITNRLILQSGIEAEIWGKDDPRHGIGSGLGTIEASFRLRYEFTRKFAPYIGVVRERLYGGTADLRRAQGGDVDDTRVVVGLRTWF